MGPRFWKRFWRHWIPTDLRPWERWGHSNLKPWECWIRGWLYVASGLTSILTLGQLSPMWATDWTLWRLEAGCKPDDDDWEDIYGIDYAASTSGKKDYGIDFWVTPTSGKKE